MLAIAEAWLAQRNGPQQQATAEQWLSGHGSVQQIETALRSVLGKLWLNAIKHGLAWAVKFGIAATFINRIVASDLVKRFEHAWVGEIAHTYMRYLAKALAGYDGTSAPDLAQLLSDVLADPAHSELIALTEVQRAMNEALLETYKAAQVKTVNWVTTSADPCPECVANREASPWPLGHPFPSGVIAPPDHPRCQCHLEPA